MVHVPSRRLVGTAATTAVAALLAAASPLAHAAQRWHAPVEAPVAHGFDLGPDPFEPGQHRGADFAARPGAAVHAACGGRVLVAGRVGTSGGVVTIRCGPWRATHMPLAIITVRAGATVRRGARIGTVGPSTAHAGLHLGARREGSRFGYIDPLRLIGRDPTTTPPVAVRRIPRGHGPRPARPVPAPSSKPALGRVPHAVRPLAAPSSNGALGRAPHTVRPLAAPSSNGALGRAPHAMRPLAAPRSNPAPRGAGPFIAPARPGSSPMAPWLAWAGLAALLAGAFGTGIRLRARPGRAAARSAATRRAAAQHTAAHHAAAEEAP